MARARNVAAAVNVDTEGLSEFDKEDLLDSVGRMLLEGIREDMNQGRSSVSGRPWKKLSPGYAKEVGREIATLFLSGQMDRALSFRTKGNSVEIGWFTRQNKDEAKKADGHNNHSGASKLPRRRSIPTPSQQFRPALRNKIDELRKSYEAPGLEPSPTERDIEETLRFLEQEVDAPRTAFELNIQDFI